MRSIRTLLLAGATVFTMKATAQLPYTWIINGVVPGCYPGQVVTLQTLPGTTPAITQTLSLSPTCGFTTVLNLSSLTAAVELSTPCLGIINTVYDSTAFNFLNDSSYTFVTINCGGSCQASFTVGQSGPWQMTTTNTSTGTAPIGYTWWMPDGSTSMAFEPTWTFSSPGVYGLCLTINDGGGCTSLMCDTVVVDSLGGINTGPVWYDCLGILYGPNLPGTPCDDGDSSTVNDTWTPLCGCFGTGTGPLDCLGIPGGPNLPGTACTDSIGGIFITGIWDSTCVCVDSLNTIYDCMGIPFGPNLPGTPCNDGNPLTTNDVWDINCVCVGGTSAPCQANFWVLQAYTIDSVLGTATPIPYTLWVWNLSSGGSGVFNFSWDFGDGNTSTDPYPTHVYGGNGPYLLCLTINDSIGCTSTHCDTVSIDSLGMYNGFAQHNDDRSGFTINVMQPVIIGGIEEESALHGLAVFPNPASDLLTTSFVSERGGTVDVSITALDGKVVRRVALPVAPGLNEWRMGVHDLNAGMYVLRIGNEREVISRRFVKRD